MRVSFCKVISRLLLVLSLAFICAVIARSQPVRVTVPCDATLWERSLSTAIAQNGVREKTGKNDGTEIEAYLSSVGLRKGQPYCQAAQYWTFSQAAKQIGISITRIPLLRTGSTQRAWQHSVRTGRRTTISPMPGDLITWGSRKGYTGHVERVIAIKTGGWVQTIGFNTSAGKAGSQRDGGGVHIRYRNWITPDMRMLVRGFTGRHNESRS